jgi:hypothetical protein
MTLMIIAFELQWCGAIVNGGACLSFVSVSDSDRAMDKGEAVPKARCVQNG